MGEDKEKLLNKKKTNYFPVIILVFTIMLIIGIFAITRNNNNNNIEDNIFLIGENAINSDGVSFCITNVQNTKTLGSGFFSDTTTNNFILIDITVTNNSKKQITIYGGCADLYNSSNIKYEYYTSLYINDIISENIGVGLSKNFQMVFETPTTTEQEDYIIKIGYSTFTSDKNRVNIKLDKSN